MEQENSVAKLRVAGIWCGVLENVPLDSWTIAALKEEISARSGGIHAADCINLISAGKVLRSEEPVSLANLGLKNNSKILASAAAPPAERNRTAAATVLAAKEEASEMERSRRLNRIR